MQAFISAASAALWGAPMAALLAGAGIFLSVRCGFVQLRHFPEAMRRLHASGLGSIICEQAQKKPLLGICLGMQMLFERSYEFEETQGLGLIPGQVRLINSGGLKIPHMGWNDLTVLHPCALTEHSKNGEYVYFVHSYCVHTPDENVSCYTEYGERIPALVHRGFVYGAQFHPEKSGEVGLAMLKNFARLCQ